MSLVFHGLFIRNFKSYIADHTLNFRRQPGLYLMRGDNQVEPELIGNSTGKTTILDAITWCGYGKTLRDERPGASIEPWTEEKGTLVVLTIERDGVFHRIERGRSPNLLTLQSNGGTTETVDQQRIDAVLGLSYDLFRCTVILPQFGPMFLNLRPEEQSTLISEALELDIWLRSADTAGTMARETGHDLGALRDAVARDEGRLVEIDAQLEAEYAAEVAFTEQSAKDLQQGMKNLRVAQEEAIALKKTAPALLEDNQSAELERALASTTALHQTNIRDVASREATLVSVEREFTQAQSRVKGYKGSTVCPECGQAVSQAHIAVKRKPLEDEVKRLARKHSELAASVTTANNILAGSEEKLATLQIQLERSRKKYVLSSATALKAHARMEQLSIQIGQLRSDVKRLETMLNPYKPAVERLTTRLAETKAGLKASMEQVASLEWQEQAYAYWQKAFRQIRLDLIDSTLKSLEGITNETAAGLGLEGWRIELATERETSDGKLARKLSVLLFPPGKVDPVRWEAYAGNEDQRWQLAVRFALAEILLEAAGVAPSIEILDEPSIHLAPRVVESLMVFLRERALKLGREIFVVEHHLLDESLFDGILDVTRTLDGAHVAWADAINLPWDTKAEPWLKEEVNAGA
jgi:DNA repair exonuclease SbcCD ATPase subunit